MLRSIGLIQLLLIALFTLVLFRVFAPLMTNHQDVTVYLKGCSTEECALKGDLTRQVLTGHYVLTQSDGTQLIFAQEAVGMMAWPAPK